MTDKELQRLLACLDSIAEATGLWTQVQATAQRLDVPWESPA